MKKIVALMLVLVMALSVCACAGVETNGDNTVANTDDSSKQSEVIKDSNNDGQIEVGTVDNVEVNEADEHLDAAEASASGKWEALFVPLNIEGRAIDMANFGRRIFEREILSVDSSTVAYGTPPTAKERYMTLMEENPELLQDVPLKYLASYLYITPQSLSRIRAGLKKK